MFTVQYFDNVQAHAPLQNILIRMGYQKGHTIIDAKHQALLNKGIETGKALCTLKTAYVRSGIKGKHNNLTILDNGIKITSGQVEKLLENSFEVVIMAATVGQAVVDERDKQIKSGDAALGVILDAVASETADAGLDWLQDFINKSLGREQRKLSRRFSAGYGDLDLSAQNLFYDALDLSKIGVAITDRFILLPEKSVIAIAGVE